MPNTTRMNISLYDYQLESIDLLRPGSILCGGVGAGKSRTSIAYFFLRICKGSLKINGEGDVKPMQSPKDLYIITTARKRDTKEWEGELAPFGLSTDKDICFGGINVVIDSWNNIKKYVDVEKAFFIFDEQRLVGNGQWVKSFLKIAKRNQWILLTATPGDTWVDYIPVLLANGFYRNRTEFVQRHVVYDRFSRYPKVKKFLDEKHLEKLRSKILVDMGYLTEARRHDTVIEVGHDKDRYFSTAKRRWNVYKEEPCTNAAELCYVLRRVCNEDRRRVRAVSDILSKHKKIIVFYNFDYELELLRDLIWECDSVAEWNGHKHEPIPDTDTWVYLVQYSAGAEGWNCVVTDAIVFYSLTYSYKALVQAKGRIDRVNTPFKDLYYYLLVSKSGIDRSILHALEHKKDFNSRLYGRKLGF